MNGKIAHAIALAIVHAIAIVLQKAGVNGPLLSNVKRFLPVFVASTKRKIPCNFVSDIDDDRLTFLIIN